jgi:glycine/D-amino acid oxidase-like deaminating enzyme/nitrite reductase/ring-hydroxylating ferredoxin subunit
VTDTPRPSLWLGTTAETAYPALDRSVSADVAVVGGGIAGITAAYLLTRAGRSVAVVDAKRIVHGATGYTTAKITAAQGTTYTDVRKGFGAEGARVYADANRTALERIAEIVDADRIDCEFERKPNYVYCETPDERSTVTHEVEAARAAGLGGELVEETPLPFPVECAFRLDGQAQFHPRKFLLRLAELVSAEGGHVFEETRVTGVKEDGSLRVVTEHGEIRTRDVVLATHLPILDRGFFFAKAHPDRSYALACRVRPDQDPHGMYINVSPPTRSVRTARDDGGLLLVLSGEGHKPGAEPDTEARYRALEDFARTHWGSNDFPFRWSTQDYNAVDKVPYVGRLTRRSDHVYVATAFKKWGMTNGVAAALILTDLILGRENPWAALYDSKRLKPLASAPAFVKENASVARHFFGDRLSRGDTTAADELSPGDGKTLKVDGKKTAAYRDVAGTLHLLSPVCTHMGCHVNWNPAEQSWDCPCHGSRFAGDGRVIQGPAVKDLARRSAASASAGSDSSRR